MKKWTPFANLNGKRIIWTKQFKLFTDGGMPIYCWYPKVRIAYYDPYWGLRGFKIYWLGREFNFEFGKDKQGLYK